MEDAEAASYTLIKAARYGDAAKVQDAIAAGADVNCLKTTRNGWMDETTAPLHEASKKGHTEIVGALLAAGADVEAIGEAFGGLVQSLGWAVLFRGLRLRVCLRSGGWPKFKMTPLHFAAEKGHTETVGALLAAGADVNADTIRLKRTPLHFAAEKGHTETVGVLIAAGANAKAGDIAKRTPLHGAALNGHTEIVGALLAAGAGVEALTKERNTPLHWAAMNGHTETVGALLAAGADVNAETIHGETPLLAAESKGKTTTAALIREWARRRIRHDPLLRWRRAVEAKRDASLVFRASAEGRPLELQQRLRLGAKSGGLEMDGPLSVDAAREEAQSDWLGREGWRCGPLMAALVGGHHDCVGILVAAWEARLEGAPDVGESAASLVASLAMRPALGEEGDHVPAGCILRQLREAGWPCLRVEALLEKCMPLV